MYSTTFFLMVPYRQRVCLFDASANLHSHHSRMGWKMQWATPSAKNCTMPGAAVTMLARYTPMMSPSSSRLWLESTTQCQ